MGNPIKAITKVVSPVVKIATAGTVDVEKGRVNLNPIKAASSVVKTVTVGTVDIQKQRINVPGSGSSLRSWASGLTFGAADKQINSPTGRLLGQIGSSALLAVGGAATLPSVTNLFSSLPGSGSAPSPNYGPVAVPVPVSYQDPAQSPISPPSGQNQQLILIAGGAIVLILLLKR